MTKKRDLSKEDKKTWEDYIKNPSDVYDKDNKSLREFTKNNRFKFDLHGFTLNQANSKVREIILFCVEKKYSEILFITGKGIHSTNDKNVYVSKDYGTLKFSVPEFLNSDQELKKFIISMDTAELKDGGEGAILIKLKNL